MRVLCMVDLPACLGSAFAHRISKGQAKLRGGEGKGEGVGWERESERKKDAGRVKTGMEKEKGREGEGEERRWSGRGRVGL